MTTTIASAPKEVLLNIFRNIESVARIAQCRLVCKQWDAAAEAAMFGQKINIKSELQAINLYAHLCKDIRKGMMIRHLHFSIRGPELPTIFKALLNLALNPNIKRLTGTVQPNSFFTTLVDIAASKGIEFSSLKELPTQVDGIHSFAAVQAMVSFKNITTLVYAVNEPNEKIVWLMNKLEKLAHLQLQGTFDSFGKLDTILSQCNRLETLELVNVAFCPSPPHHRVQNANIFPLTVTTVDSLQSIKISLWKMRPDIIEYLCYKYPKLKSFEMKTVEFNRELPSLRWEHMKRVLACVSEIPSRNLTIDMLHDTNMFDALLLAETSTLNIQYCIGKNSVGNRALIMKVT